MKALKKPPPPPPPTSAQSVSSAAAMTVLRDEMIGYVKTLTKDFGELLDITSTLNAVVANLSEQNSLLRDMIALHTTGESHVSYMAHPELKELLDEFEKLKGKWSEQRVIESLLDMAKQLSDGKS